MSRHRAHDIAAFVVNLANEGERSAVVLGASRADTILEEMLKIALHNHPGGDDNLFDLDRPLSTFSARIALSFRLGLIDEACEHALQMLRKIRNEFAHSISKASLSESRHRNRVLELAREAKKSGQIYTDFEKIFANCEPMLREFCTAVTIILARLEYTATNAKRIDAPFCVSLATPISMKTDASQTDAASSTSEKTEA